MHSESEDDFQPLNVCVPFLRCCLDISLQQLIELMFCTTVGFGTAPRKATCSSLQLKQTHVHSKGSLFPYTVFADGRGSADSDAVTPEIWLGCSRCPANASFTANWVDAKTGLWHALVCLSVRLLLASFVSHIDIQPLSSCGMENLTKL